MRHWMMMCLGVCGIVLSFNAFAVEPQRYGSTSAQPLVEAKLVGVMAFGAGGIAVIKDEKTGRTAAVQVGGLVPFAPAWRVTAVARGRVEVTSEGKIALIVPEDSQNTPKEAGEDLPPVFDDADFPASSDEGLPVIESDPPASAKAPVEPVIEEVVIDEAAQAEVTPKGSLSKMPRVARADQPPQEPSDDE